MHHWSSPVGFLLIDGESQHIRLHFQSQHIGDTYILTRPNPLTNGIRDRSPVATDSPPPVGVRKFVSHNVTVRQFPRHRVQGISSYPLGGIILCQPQHLNGVGVFLLSVRAGALDKGNFAPGYGVLPGLGRRSFARPAKKARPGVVEPWCSTRADSSHVIMVRGSNTVSTLARPRTIP